MAYRLRKNTLAGITKLSFYKTYFLFVDSIFYFKKSSLTEKIYIDSFLSFILFANTISPHLMLKYSQFRFNLGLNKTINLDFESHLFH